MSALIDAFWRAAAYCLHPRVIALSLAPLLLAGGLTPATVAEAIHLTGATAVDVSSGVESRPGEKDPELIRSFLHAAKTARETR